MLWKTKKRASLQWLGESHPHIPLDFHVAGCHRLWCLNDFEHIIKEIPQEVISWRPEEPVDTNTVHTLYQGMPFICLHDDPRIKVIVIFNHAPLPNEISTFPSNCFCCHLLSCHVKSEILCGEALTSQLLLRGTHATNFPVKDFSWSECDHLVIEWPHNEWER